MENGDTGVWDKVVAAGSVVGSCWRTLLFRDPKQVTGDYNQGSIATLQETGSSF